MAAPTMIDDDAFRCLRAEDIDGFHRAVLGRREVVDLSGANLRGVNLRHADLERVILRNAYLRDADLRGQDLRGHDLTGASLRNARVSGVLFPPDLTADEIRMSVQLGTRLRSAA